MNAIGDNHPPDMTVTAVETMLALKQSTRGWPIPEKLRHFSIKNKNGCWIWHGLLSIDGYGRIGLGRNKHYFAHKISWKYHFGVIPKGMNVLHACDTPACINPEHLFLGTHQDNMRDMAVKLRAAKKLNPQIVKEIRIDPRSQRVIAKKYGIAQSTVGDVKNKKIWSHIND